MTAGPGAQGRARGGGRRNEWIIYAYTPVIHLLGRAIALQLTS